MFTKNKADGTVVAQPHKLRVMLRDKVGDLLSRYTLDEVLSEIAAQRPAFDIHLSANMGEVSPNGRASGMDALSGGKK
jgi:hypothetical protein